MFIYSATPVNISFLKVNNSWIVYSLKICRTKSTFCLLRFLGESAFAVNLSQYLGIYCDSSAWRFYNVQNGALWILSNSWFSL